MYRALFCVAYYGLFRIEELTSGSHPVMAKNVHIGRNKDKILFVLRTSKTHNAGDLPQTVKITGFEAEAKVSNRKNIEYCPFNIMRNFLQLRPFMKTEEEPFFVFRDNTAVKPDQARIMLRQSLLCIKINPSNYSFHSIRIGRSSDLLAAGVSVETIKKLGRWKSNVVYKYLRLY